MTNQKDTSSTQPVDGFFEGERLELLWRYVYQPDFVPLLKKYIGIKSGMHILDVGSGTGFLSRFLAKHTDDLTVVGLEYDEELIDIGQEMVAREGLTKRVEMRKGDAYALPFPDESFDLVASQTLL